MAINTQNRTTAFAAKQAGNPVFQSIFLIIVIVLFAWFLLRPWLEKTLDTRAELNTEQKVLDSIQADQRELNRLVNQLRTSPEEIALVDEALPLNGRISKVNVLLDSLVRSSGMTLAVLSADDTQSIVSAGDKTVLANPYQPGRKLHTITVSASITGTMEQLKNLLQLMETNGRVLDVESLQILGGEPVTKFRMTVNAYAYENVTEPVTKSRR